MRIFIGTMQCGEGDFEQCKIAIRGQNYTLWQHVVVSNMTEQMAHKRLYEEWNEAKSDFDLFLKVDADTVLANPFVVSTFVKLFEENKRLTGVQAWLDDYMTCEWIYGLTCIRNTVSVSTNVDPLFCDRVDTKHDIVIRGYDIKDENLLPAGQHCHYASEVQAFRYGIHRAKKHQRLIRDSVHKAWLTHGHDRIRGMALIGFDMASSCASVDYESSDFKNAISYATSNYDELTNKLKMS